MTTETDPHGLKSSDAGAKLDSGKLRPGLIMKGFAHAFWEISKVGTCGAAKYSELGFLDVENGEDRYEDAQMRHMLKRYIDGKYDDELTEFAQKLGIGTEVLHMACEAWNAMAKLELHMRALKKEEAKKKLAVLTIDDITFPIPDMSTVFPSIYKTPTMQMQAG